MKIALVLVAVLAIAGYLFVRMRARSKQAHELVAKGAVLLDVRTPQEFAAGHLPGARNIPVHELGQRFRDVGSRDEPVVVYCRSGGRSAAAKSILDAKGFKEVVNLGPMAAW